MKSFSSVFIVDFEQVNVKWIVCLMSIILSLWERFTIQMKYVYKLAGRRSQTNYEMENVNTKYFQKSMTFSKILGKNKLYGPFLWMGFNCLKARATSRRQFTFYEVPRNSWYSFYQPRKVERLSRPWSHPVILNTGPLDWQSSALNTRQLLCMKLESEGASSLKRPSYITAPVVTVPPFF